MKELIDHTKIEIPLNYVLIKPDSDQEKFHIDGKESNLYVGKSAMVYVDGNDSIDFSQKESMDTFADHWSITGTVIKTPKKLEYHGRDIESIRVNNDMDIHDMQKMSRLMAYSMKYDVPMEMQPGDKVVFDPQVHITVSDEEKSIETDIGLLYFVRYDRFRAIIKEEEIYPVNGVVLFRWIQPKEITFGGLTLAVSEKRIWDADHKEAQVGEVLAHGYNVKSMISEGGVLSGIDFDIKKGDRFLFKQTAANNLETEGHFHLFGGEEVLMIRQEEILAIVD